MGTGPLVENNWSRYFQDHYCEINARLTSMTSPNSVKRSVWSISQVVLHCYNTTRKGFVVQIVNICFSTKIYMFRLYFTEQVKILRCFWIPLCLFVSFWHPHSKASDMNMKTLKANTTQVNTAWRDFHQTQECYSSNCCTYCTHSRLWMNPMGRFFLVN